MTTDKNTSSANIEVDTHWGVLAEGEAARIFGSGSPNEVTSGAQMQKSEELED